MGIVSFGRRDFLGTDAWAERKPKMICERCQKEFETLNNGHCPKCWEELLVFMRRNIKQLDEDVAAHERDEDAPDPEEE